MIIAIDGTLASGKGTIAKRLAAWYGLPHMDTGRLYRATGVSALKAGVALDDGEALARLASELDPGLFEEAELRTAEAGSAASRVAAIGIVRAALLQLQRDFAHQAAGAVLDGRDIGTVVCPEAEVKLWIDADRNVRAERRHRELAAAGDPVTLEELSRQLEERDQRDSTRKDAPMKMAADAVLIDTTHLTIDAAVEKARAAVEAVMARQEQQGSGA